MTKYLKLSKKMEERLETLALKTQRSKSYYMKKAIETFLEDQEDYLLALAVLEQNNDKISFDEMKKRLGIERAK